MSVGKSSSEEITENEKGLCRISSFQDFPISGSPNSISITSPIMHLYLEESSKVGEILEKGALEDSGYLESTKKGIDQLALYLEESNNIKTVAFDSGSTILANIECEVDDSEVENTFFEMDTDS